MERYGWRQRGAGALTNRDRSGPQAARGTWSARLASQQPGRILRWDAGLSTTGGAAASSGSGGTAAAGEAFWENDDPAAKRQRVEAVLLLSRGPVTRRKLAQLAGLADATEARTLVRQLNQRYAEDGRAFSAEEVAGGYQLMTRPALAPWIRRLGHIPSTIQLSPPALETMAIVAYRQPVLRADIEAIRGVACGEILRQLMEKDLVRISGRSEELGRPYLYSTTKLFLQTFGLHSADALPALDESEIEISDDPNWSDESPSTDPSLDPSAVSGTPEEKTDVSTVIDRSVIENAPQEDATLGITSIDSTAASTAPVAVIEDEEDDIYLDDDDDDDDELDDDFDEDWDDEDEDEDLDDDGEDDDEEDTDWEEVEEDWDDEDEEADDDDDLDDDLDDWGDDDAVEDDDEEEDEWD